MSTHLKYHNVDMTKTTADRLKYAREMRGWTQARLAVAADVSQGTVGNIESGARQSRGSLPRLAKALGVSHDWLADGVGDMHPTPKVETSNVVLATIGTRRVPLISYVQAGCWAETTDPATVGDGFEYLLTDLELSGSAFALEIEGNSMLPQFKPGDRVIVDPEVCPQPGDFVVAMNGGNEATFKKYRPRGVDQAGNDVFELMPLNEDFAPMRSDQTPIRIVGTMMEHRQYRKRS